MVEHLDSSVLSLSQSSRPEQREATYKVHPSYINPSSPGFLDTCHIFIKAMFSFELEAVQEYADKVKATREHSCDQVTVTPHLFLAVSPASHSPSSAAACPLAEAR